MALESARTYTLTDENAEKGITVNLLDLLFVDTAEITFNVPALLSLLRQTVKTTDKDFNVQLHHALYIIRDFSPANRESQADEMRIQFLGTHAMAYRATRTPNTT